MKEFRTALSLLCLMVLGLFPSVGKAAVGDIVTVAGGIIRDGGPAIQANLLYPSDVAVAGDGRVFLVDQGNNRIRVVAPGTGIITTVAGSATGGYTGDNMPATSAALRAPTGMALDGAGNIYIADQGNNRIRKVTASGTITTIAGTGAAGFSGDGGPATSASLNQPFDVTVDSTTGDVFFSDQGNNRIRKISASDGTISTVAGNGSISDTGDNGRAVDAGLYSPAGLTFDASGNLYFADQFHNRIRKISSGGVITAFAGDGSMGYAGDNGPATSAWMGEPSSVAVSGSDVYIVDRENHVIRKVSGGIITTVAGTGMGGYSGDAGPAALATLRHPAGISVDAAGNVYFSEQGNSTVRKITAATGIIDTIAGGGTGDYSGDGGPALSAGMHMPWSVAVFGGDIYISDRLNNRIRKVSGTTGIITTVVGNGFGGYFGDGGGALDARIGNPRGITIDSSTGDLYIADTGNNRVRMVSGSTGIITTVAGNGNPGYSGDGGQALAASLSGPGGVALDGAGNLYIADQDNNVVRKVSAGSGVITTVAGNGTGAFAGDGGPATSASLFSPAGVTVDGAGNIFIADMDNHRIRKVTASTGIITTVAGNGIAGYTGDNVSPTSTSLYFPAAVKIDSDGNILVVDQYNMRIRKIAGGRITNIAGNGMWDYAGDNGPATAASISYPTDVAVDSSGNIIIADRINNTIRKVLAAAAAPTVPGAPAGVSAAAGNGQATVTFAAPASNGGSAITGYTVTSNPAGGTDSNAGSTGLSHVVTGLVNGTAYTFTVTATNAAGSGPASAPSNSVTPAAPVSVPGAPTITGVVAGNGQVTVTFSAPASDGGSPITGYLVTSSPAGGVDSNAGSTALSHVITGLSNGSAYTFTVTARNAAGSGAPSAASASIVPANPHDGIIVPGTGKAAPDISDVVMALRYVIGSGSLTAGQLTHADVAPLGPDGNPLGDNRVDIADVIILLRRSIGVGSW